MGYMLYFGLKVTSRSSSPSRSRSPAQSGAKYASSTQPFARKTSSRRYVAAITSEGSCRAYLLFIQ